MKEWKRELKLLTQEKTYMIWVVAAVIGAFGFMIGHHTVGIDDTPYAYYFQEGLAPIVGRWVLFVLNRLVSIGEFAPFLTDLAGACLLALGGIVWSLLFRHMAGERLPVWAYGAFAALLISQPLHSEVFTYFLHNGVGLGYFLCALSLIFLWAGEETGREEGFKKRLVRWSAGGLCLWAAIGCYESFMVVYLVGLFLFLCLEKICGRGGSFVRDLRMLGIGEATALGALILRSVTVRAVTGIWGLAYLKDAAVQRSVSEMTGWLANQDGRAQMMMAVKRALVQYGVFGLAYLPIGIYVAAILVGFAAVSICSILRKDWRIILFWGLALISSYALIPLEGKVTLYRSAQFLPLFCAWSGGLFLLLLLEWCKKRRSCELVLAVFMAALIWNQCAEMNKWFYVDYLKYEDAKRTTDQIAYELDKGFDTSKPLIFTGTYELPEDILQNTYIAYNSKTFYRLKKWAGMIDETILEKYNRKQGVWVAQTPALSVLDWARYAFDTDEELIRFFAMHGHKLVPCLQTQWYEEAEEYSLQLPSFPEEGAIVDRGEYIVVHF